MPVPSADHAAPSHRAALLGYTSPLGIWNAPAAFSVLPRPSSNSARDRMSGATRPAFMLCHEFWLRYTSDANPGADAELNAPAPYRAGVAGPGANPAYRAVVDPLASAGCPATAGHCPPERRWMRVE